MGITKTARDDFSADLAAFKATTTPNREQLRKYVSALTNAGLEWLSKRDAQDTTALSDFAASKQGQWNSFTDALPDIELAPVDPNS